MFERPLAWSWRLAVHWALALTLVCGTLVAGTAPLQAEPRKPEILRVGGTGAALGVLSRLAVMFNTQQSAYVVTVVYPSVGSSGAILGVIRKDFALGFSSRPLKDDEEAQGITAIELARTPLVLATARANPPGLTLGQLVDIFAGRTLHWPDGSRLRLVLRPSTDVETLQLQAISPEMKQAVDSALARPGMVIANTDQAAADLIAQSPGGLGATTLALIRSENRPLHSLALEGVEPDLSAIQEGRYPYVRKFFVVMGPLSGAGAAAFLAFLGSPQGREVLQNSGYWVTLKAEQ